MGHPLLTPDGHRMAAVLACGPGAFLSLRSAAAAWGLRRTSRTSVEVTTTRRGCRPKPGIDVQHVRASPRRHHHAPWHPDHLGRAYPELDGAAAHHTARAFEDDRRRDAAMTACGYAVVRLTWRRVTREGSAVAEELRRMLAPRGAAAAP